MAEMVSIVHPETGDESRCPIGALAWQESKGWVRKDSVPHETPATGEPVAATSSGTVPNVNPSPAAPEVDTPAP